MMDRNMILKKAMVMFSAVTEEEEITEESGILDDLGVMSMDVLMIVSALEAEFNIKIATKEIYKARTVGDIVDLVAARKN